MKQSFAGQAAFAAATLAAGLLAFSAPIDGGLGRTTGALPAAFWDFFGAMLIMLVVLLATGQLRRLGGVRNAPPVAFLGGFCGACFVTGGVVTVGALGAGGVAAAAVTGQLLAAVVIDRLGLLGLERTPLTPVRVAGVLALIAGTLLITTV